METPDARNARFLVNRKTIVLPFRRFFFPGGRPENKISFS
ncbi:hypothetical protein OPIT5_16450 [Opitutaceae bacterium TAV5]|nr:hypothetical protein OPIT5_16450 [Opitutaceae bacterium TAV5]